MNCIGQGILKKNVWDYQQKKCIQAKSPCPYCMGLGFRFTSPLENTGSTTENKL
jgi:hypothetical protein